MIHVITNKDIKLGDGMRMATFEDCLTYLKTTSFVGFDIETTGLDPHTDKILSMQFGDKSHQFVVDLTNVNLDRYRYYFNKILTKMNLVIHNAKFDLKFLYKLGIYPKSVWDTFLAEAVLNKGDRTVRKNLKIVIKRYFNVDIDKSFREGIRFAKFDKNFIKYAATDVEYLLPIKAEQRSELGKKDLTYSMWLENEFVKVLAYVEYSGIYLNADKWSNKILLDIQEHNTALNKLNKWIIINDMTKYLNSQLSLFESGRHCSINWSSSKQVIPLLKDLGVNTQVVDEKTGELKDSADATILKRQEDKSPFISLYLNFKRWEKVISTYGTNFLDQINSKTGRIHSQFTQIMNTGRMSSGGNRTVNLQNLPADPRTRECFTASKKENVLINADYSGQEQIILANWSLDKDLLDFYRNGETDMHALVCSKIFPELAHTPLKEFKDKYPKQRDIAKTVGFAINYGGDGSTIAKNANISEEEGQRVYDSYFKEFSGINNYFKRVKDNALRYGFIKFNSVTKSKSFITFFEEFQKMENTVHARGFWEIYREEKAKDSKLYQKELRPLVRHYFKKKGDIERKALNYPVQGSGAEITKLACIYIFKVLRDDDLLDKVFMSNIVHDEVLLECERGLAGQLSKVVEECMNRAADQFCTVIPLKATPIISDWWQH